ncbi:glycoside hydrolase family 31 protein [Coraliomargarita algicola]|uniref:Glycoside hydrolase family 31 protein n=1 Tax=Coraliomargarita algicola TaxID=3092156 RepID=A0ABZ0RNC3_9BACT|nr:TIM-barrel domain-containing protein [Coraliomargarita sp. J2-16]WPJ97017.1 glycoside hydrolase family 31 protein [Coraliomargarita sp. J2-16]
MKQTNYYPGDMLDLDTPESKNNVVYVGGHLNEAKQCEGKVQLNFAFESLVEMPKFSEYQPAAKTAQKAEHLFEVKAYSDQIIRMRCAFDGSLMSDSGPILSIDPELTPVPLNVEKQANGWKVLGAKERCYVEVDHTPAVVEAWRDDKNFVFPDQPQLSVYPNPDTKVQFVNMDAFNSSVIESLGMGYIEGGGQAKRSFFSVYCDQLEKFVGTGERFCNLDLRGQVIQVENTDGIGTNSRRTYKNVPMYISSRGYAIFIHTSYNTRLSMAAVSSNSVSAMIEEPVIDLFVVGGSSIAEILKNYCRLTGFVPELPLWSYGMWMARVTYYSAEEVREVARKLRERKHPADVLHVDTAWFEEDWICDWKFGSRFPDPRKFIEELGEQNYKLTLWQTPYIRRTSSRAAEAVELGYLGESKADGDFTGSDWGTGMNAGHIDFSNPAAVKWYQDMLSDLFDMGVAAIKTDFGEDITLADYQMDYDRLHNIYGMLYQQAAADVTKEKTGTGLIWARAGWAGSQRNPVHWGGDTQCSWNGMLSTLKGALNVGLSGFAYWSCDLPGFYGYPVAFKSKPSDLMYLRWTQFGVFESHMRYHGQWPREPWHYPTVEDDVRSWLNLRYMLIPYILEQSKVASETGLPLMRSLILHHEEDPMCWHINDQYYFGDDLLIAPIANDEGIRDVYLPKGEWVDFWTGETLTGEIWLKQIRMPVSRIPVYVKKSAKIAVYPEIVQSTAEMDLKKVKHLCFDETYSGFVESLLAISGIE